METLTDEDLDAIEQLMKQRSHVKLPREKWSAAMLKSMLDKVGPLLREVRQLRKEREILKLTIEMDIESTMLKMLKPISLDDIKTEIVKKAKSLR